MGAELCTFSAAPGISVSVVLCEKSSKQSVVLSRPPKQRKMCLTSSPHGTAEECGGVSPRSRPEHGAVGAS